jgi:pyrroline-5-carboxylate reductase
VKVGFIGGGKIAEAMIASLLRGRVAQAHELFVSDISAARRDTLKTLYGVNAYSRNRAVPGSVEVLVLAVKPQDLAEVLKELAPDIGPGHLVISIAAGKTLSFVEALLPGARVIRVMPNLACQVAEGMSVFCPGPVATEADRRTAERMLSSFGRALELPEAAFDAVTALSGSGPAFFAFVLDAMIGAAVEEGLTAGDASVLARQTMLGTGRLLIERDTPPSDLIAAVASPGGTTIAGLAVLEKSDLRAVIARTIKAAAHRSRELSN